MTDKQRKICEDLGWKVYEDKEDNGMAWNDAASAAFHEVINQQ